MPTYPLTLPDFELVGARMRLLRGTTKVQSPFTGKRQVGELPFALWGLSFKLPILDEEESRDWKVFVAELRGQYGTFKALVPGYNGPTTGYAGAVGVVAGASQLGTSLVTDGWANSQSIFHKSNFFTVNNELKMLTAAASSNGSGQMTVSFEPALRSSPADNAVIEIANPYAVMASINDDMGWDISPPELYDMAFEAVEAF